MTITINGTTGIASVDGSAGSPSVRGSDSNSGIVYAADAVAISTAGLERSRIDNNGNLCVGITGGSAKLHTKGDQSGGMLKCDAVEGTTRFFVTGNDTSDVEVNLYEKAGGQRGILVGGNAEFAIKAPNSTAPLTFYTHNGTAIAQRAELNAYGWWKMKGNATSSDIGSGDSYHEIRSDKAHNVTLAMQHDSSEGYGIIARFNHGKSSHYAYRVHNYASGSDNMFIRTDGDCENVNNSYGSTSDVKLKENIVDAKSQWNDIKALRIRNFNYKADDNKTKLLGLVAQEAETVCPSLVKTQPDLSIDNEDLGTETKYLKYSILYMKSIKALQEAMTKIETLETEVNTLKTKVAALEAA